MRPRQASELAVCSCGNKRGTRESKELVGVAAPSDPVGSILVKILHSVEGGDVVQVCSNLETNLSCLRLLSLSLTFVYILHAYIVYLFICLIYLVLNCYMLGIVCSHLYSTKRAIVAPQLLI